MSTISLDDYRGFTPRTVRTTPQADVRLTRRGRLAVVLVALAALAVLAVAFGSSTVASGDAGAVPATEVVTVEQGQTLWQIAAEANPDGDIRQTVDDIMTMNSLPSAGGLQMGSDIAVPVYE